MCGRYVSTTTPAQLADYFSVDELVAEDVTPNYNVAPTQTVLTVVERADHRLLETCRWGLVPSWAKDPSVGNKMINARAETVATKPAYRRALAKRRCIVPADGFFEWKRAPDGKQRQPYFIHSADGRPLAFAGLWEWWPDPTRPEGEGLRSCAIVTTEANALVAPIHDRMPVVLPREAWDAWLDPDADDVEALSRLLVPIIPEGMEAYPVPPRVNSPRNNGPENLERDPEPVV